MLSQSFKQSIQPLSFWPSFVAITGFIGLGALFTDQLGRFLNGALNTISFHFDWLFILTALGCFFLTLYFAFSRFGDIRLGGDDSQPELSLWQWFSVCLCSGIGTGILFWGMGEPIFFYAQPSEAVGIEAFSRQAGVNAISQAAFHWSIIQYCMYTIGALAVAMIAYQKKESFSVSTSLYGLLGDKHNGKVGQLVNALCIFTLSGALLLIGSGEALDRHTNRPCHLTVDRYHYHRHLHAVEHIRTAKRVEYNQLIQYPDLLRYCTVHAGVWPHHLYRGYQCGRSGRFFEYFF